MEVLTGECSVHDAEILLISFSQDIFAYNAIDFDDITSHLALDGTNIPNDTELSISSEITSSQKRSTSSSKDSDQRARDEDLDLLRKIENSFHTNTVMRGEAVRCFSNEAQRIENSSLELCNISYTPRVPKSLFTGVTYWTSEFLSSFNLETRWKTRSRASNEIRLLSMVSCRDCMLDKKIKGGQSFVLRCERDIRENTMNCSFYAKLRRSSDDRMWYICPRLNPIHTCPPGLVALKIRNIATLLEERKTPE